MNNENFDLDFIDEDAVHAGITASNQFAVLAEETAQILQWLDSEASSGWRGKSYGIFSTLLAEITMLVRQSAANSRSAAGSIGIALEQALSDEQEAEEEVRRRNAATQREAIP